MNDEIKSELWERAVFITANDMQKIKDAGYIVSKSMIIHRTNLKYAQLLRAHDIN
jgi:hypothetical protein